ncbi:MAG: polysaccharide deacetylase family protein [Clostridia bacterium]|nr:polysaccharide deacetylase family protein [Clostridia bacterium]
MKNKLIAYIFSLIMGLSIVFGMCSCDRDIPITNLDFQEYKDKGIALDSEICMVKNDSKGIVTIISDDGYYDSGVILKEIAKELEINVTVAGAVNIISPKLKEWQLIENEGYVDIVSHSYSHIKVSPEANLTQEQIRHEYLCAKEYYEKYFNTPAFTIVAPENITTEYGFSVWREIGILAARLGARGENSLKDKITYGTAQGQWLNLRMWDMYDANNTATRNNFVDRAINHNTWIIEMYHDISPTGEGHFKPISTQDAREHFSYISEQQKLNNIWAASFTQAVSYIYQRDFGEIEAYRIGDSIAVSYNRLRDDLPWSEFNVPVTIKVYIPSDMNIKTVNNGDNDVTFDIVDGYAIFDVPTNGDIIYLQ